MSENEIDNCIEAGAGIAAATADDFEMTPAAPVLPASSKASAGDVVANMKDESDPVKEEVIVQLAEAAEGVATETEAAAVMGALSHTPGVNESRIAPDVLAKLLPDNEIVVLPDVERIAGGLGYRIAKRAFDVIASLLALVILAIPMAAIALMIRAESPGPALFSQKRIGKDGQVFELYKFRSMYVNAEVCGAQWATEGDPRVTPLGRRLRGSRLDELPQFWNVLKGDMSLIGPRPERPMFSDEFARRIDGWEQRLMVKPGITGLAQVTGGYELLPKEKAIYDIEYIENRSMGLDLRIMWRTVRIVFTGDGAR